jgi:hypothetical protein
MATSRKVIRAYRYARWLATAGILTAVILWFAFPTKFRPRGKRVASALAEGGHEPHLSLSATEGPIRRAYPYSVIPGGVYNVRELTDAIGRDPLVAAHYLGFDVTRARVIRLSQDRMVYVSYRRNNQIFWTKKNLKLTRGEALITDGTHTARTRCGNLVSEIPVGPVSPNEPGEQTLDTLQNGTADTTLTAANLNLPLLRRIPGSPAGASDPASPGVFPPLVGEPGTIAHNSVSQTVSNSSPAQTDPTTPGGSGNGLSGGGNKGGGGDPNGAPDPATIVTPEPGTITLVSSGLAALWLARKRKRR